MRLAQNVAAHLVFNHLTRPHITSMLMELWLPVAPQVQVTYADLQSTSWIRSLLLEQSRWSPSTPPLLHFSH